MAKKLFTKVIVAILLLSMMLALVVSCGGSDADTKKPAGTTASAGDNNTPGNNDPANTTPDTTVNTPVAEYPAQL